MNKLRICVMAGKQAGIVGLLTILAKGHKILSVVAYDDIVKMICRQFKIKFYESIKDESFIEDLKNSDMLFCIHGREIVPEQTLSIPKIASINVHPCLYINKGKNPIKRLLENNNPIASVGSHFMTSEIDEGEVIFEKKINVEVLKTVIEVYNKLYPYYSYVISKTIDEIHLRI